MDTRTLAPSQENTDSEDERGYHEEFFFPPGEMPISLPKHRSGSPFPWKSYLLNSWLISGIILLLTTVAVTVVSSVLSNNIAEQAAQQQQVDDTQVNLQRAAQNLTDSSHKLLANITTTDLHPIFASKPGLLQKLAMNGGGHKRQEIAELKGDRFNTKTYGKSEDYIRHRSIAEAMKIVNSAGAGNDAVLIYKDPSTGKLSRLRVSPTELQASGIFKLLELENSSRDGAQHFDLSAIALDVAALQNEKQDSVANYLDAQMQNGAADNIRNVDLEGNEKIPVSEAQQQTEQMVTVPLAPPPEQKAQIEAEPKPKPTSKSKPPAKTKAEINFYHVNPHGLTMP
ncbi:MAG: hypothetical protein WBB28_20865 [Crinalium sp.]